MESNENKSILSKLRNNERYRAQVDAIYQTLNEESSALGITPDTEIPEGSFSFEDYPKTKKLIDELIATYKSDVSNEEEAEPIEKIFEDRGVVKINIRAFIREYMANIPIDTFIELKNLRYRQYCTSTEIPLSLYEDIKKRKLERDIADERSFKTAEANNEGIAFEKNGNIEKAIERYEWNIYENHCVALHSFNRLIVLYGKRKDEANKRRILEKGIDVFENLYPTVADKYRARLTKELKTKN